WGTHVFGGAGRCGGGGRGWRTRCCVPRGRSWRRRSGRIWRWIGSARGLRRGCRRCCLGRGRRTTGGGEMRRCRWWSTGAWGGGGGAAGVSGAGSAAPVACGGAVGGVAWGGAGVQRAVGRCGGVAGDQRGLGGGDVLCV